MIDLYNGDCLEIMKNIPDGSVDMALCDLPYGTTNCEWDKPIDLQKLWVQYRRICKPNGAIVLFSAQPFTTDLINSNRKEFRYEIIWAKTQPTGFLNANRMPLRNHEVILVFYRKLPTYNPIKTKIDVKGIGRVKVNGTKAQQYNDYITGKYEYIETGERMPTDVICFSNWNGALFGDTKKTIKHPTSKPIPLLEYLIKTYSNKQEIVIDNCMGSGSTGVACVNTNRNFIGIELNREYYEIATERIKMAQSEPKQQSFFDGAPTIIPASDKDINVLGKEEPTHSNASNTLNALGKEGE